MLLGVGVRDSPLDKTLMSVCVRGKEVKLCIFRSSGVAFCFLLSKKGANLSCFWVWGFSVNFVMTYGGCGV